VHEDEDKHSVIQQKESVKQSQQTQQEFQKEFNRKFARTIKLLEECRESCVQSAVDLLWQILLQILQDFPTPKGGGLSVTLPSKYQTRVILISLMIIFVDFVY
jgi:hypothetical protein